MKLQKAPSAWILFTVLILCGILALTGVLHSGRLVLTAENRVAAQLTAPSSAGILNGSWQQNTRKALSDRFPLRQQLITLDRFAENTLLLQTESSGILLGKQGWMFTKLTPLTGEAADRLERNVKAVEALGKTASVPVSLMLVPSAAAVYSENLPDFCTGSGAPLLDEAALLQEIQIQLTDSVEMVELLPKLLSGKEQQLYYKTDHHWTTFGAYLGYQAYCQSVGLAPMSMEDGQTIEAAGFCGTHYAAARLSSAQPDVIFCWLPEGTVSVYDVLGDAEFSLQRTLPIVDTEMLTGSDPYSAFLGGNHGYCVIEGRGEGKLLVVKDSYANCFVPFLTENYAQIGIVDYRNYAYGLESLISKEGYDRVLVLYCLQSFLTDRDVPKMNRPPVNPA